MIGSKKVLLMHKASENCSLANSEKDWYIDASKQPIPICAVKAADRVLLPLITYHKTYIP